MSDQQQNAELATDLDNDLTLFLVHRLLICSSIDAVENRKQDSKKQQSRTVWRTLSRLVGNRKKKEAEVVGQSVVDLARLWKSCQRWWWNDCGPAETRSMPILQVKTQESIDDPLSDHTASASTSQGAPTDGQHGQASSVQHHHRRTILSSQRGKMTPPVSQLLPTRRVKPVTELQKAKPQDSTVMKPEIPCSSEISLGSIG